MSVNSTSSYPLLALTLIKSYPVTVFAMLMLCFALMAGTLGLSAVLGLQQLNQSNDAELAAFEPRAYFQIQGKGEQPIRPTDIAQVKSQVPFPVVAYLTDSLISDSGTAVDVLALDSLAVLSARPYLEQAGSGAEPLTQGSLFGQSIRLNSLTLTGLADDELFTQVEEMDVDWLVSEDIDDNLLIMDLGVWSDIKPAWLLSGAFILTDNQHYLNEIRTALPPHLRMIEPLEQFTATQLSDSFQLNLLAMGLLMFAVCLFIVINATNLLLHKRFSMFTVLRQLGFGRNKIVVSLFLEMTLVVILCTGVGTVLGYELVRWLTQELDAIIFIDLKLAPSMKTTLLIVFCIVWLGVGCACTPFFLRLRESLDGASSHRFTMQPWLLIVSVLLVMLSIVLFTVFSMLSVMLFATACLILGLSIFMLWLLPVVLARLSGSSAIRSYQFTLLLKSCVALSQQTRLAFCAFFIAITSNMAMNIMVDSFRGATEQWLQQRLVSDAYLYVDRVNVDDFYQETGLSSLNLTPRFVSQQQLNERQVQVFSYPTTREFQQAMLLSDKLPDVWQQFTVTSKQTVQSVLVNQQFFYANGYALGDVFGLIDPVTQQLIQVTIVGVFYDYGNSRGQVLLPVEYFLGHSVEADLFAVNGLTQAAIASVLTDADITFDFYRSEDLVELSMQEFDNTFVITDALNVVTLLVAALSLACTVSVLLDNTRAERFLFRSLGFSSQQLLLGSVLQYGLLLVLACTLAMPAGAIVAWVLIEQINFTAFFWTYPLAIQPMSVFPVVFISVCIVLATIYIPLRKTSSKSLTEELSWLD